MSKSYLIFKREVSVYFYSTLFFSVFCLFLASTGFLFLQVSQGQMGERVTLSTIMFKLIFFCWLPIIVTFLSMQFFAEERKNGQLELILTFPLTTAQLIAGKFAASMLFLLLIFLSASGYICYTEIMAGGKIVSVASSLLSGLTFLLFFGMFALSIGVFSSTLTSNHLLCSTITFIMIMFFYFIGYITNLIPYAPTFMKEYLDFPAFLNNFCDGIIDSRPLIFCFSATVLFLFYSIKVLEVSKHR